KMRLEWVGYQVTAMDSENGVVTKMHHQAYDLLIIDFTLSKPNGFPLLEALKNQNILPPTIVVGNDADNSQVINAMQIECIDYIIKSHLIQNYVDQINLSISRFFENCSYTTEKNNKLKNSLVNSTKCFPTNISNWEYYLSGDLVYWSDVHNKIKITLSYDEFTDRVHQDDVAYVKMQNNISLLSHKPVEYQFRFLSDNNRETTFYTQVKTKVGSDGIVKKLYGKMQAISFQNLKNEFLQLKSAFFDNTNDAVFIADSQNRIVSVNNAFTTITGYTEQGIYKKSLKTLNPEWFNNFLFKKITVKLKNENFWQGEVSICHSKGHPVSVWLSSYVLKDSTGNILQSISVFKDITEQRCYENLIEFQANYDPLTQLPNRTLFLDRLASTIKLSKRNNTKLALMLLDLNKFKWINDTLGHHAGDILLQETSKLLLASVRNTDTVARLGGDEFSIILPDLEKITDAELIASKIFNSFKKAIFIDQQEIYISGSIGITIFPDDGNEIDTLQKNADSAMYIAKNKGDDNSYYYFTQALQQKTEKRLKLIEDMRLAILNHEFTLHYQPIIDIITNKVVSAETLLRWKHPQIGYVPLKDFIPIAEETGLIQKIGNWVIEEVANNIQRWSTLGFPPLQISLNQSVAQYSLSECHIEWLNILKKKQISPSNLTFEISEKIFIEEKTDYLKSIEKLKQAGIQISLDSFGTGYSSLSYLEKFPVDVIKIDRSYIHNMIEKPTNAILVETIVFLANKLGIKVIATCVENKKQLDLLYQQCRFAQGYYFSKPLSLFEFENYIKKHRNGVCKNSNISR
ncbi:MAG: EAL domain-containing protein, partial [Methylococcales bacterium]|nr:EAL domain-containing protein [Methylococcales bacterium]